MYLYERDGSSADLVGMLVARSGLDPNADHAGVMRSVKEQWKAPRVVERAPATIIIIDDDYPVPDATRRKGYAELRDHSPYGFRLAIVTGSMLIRGAHRAINWVRPPSPRFESDSFATFDAAASWIGGGTVWPSFSRLHGALLQRLRAG